MGSLELPVFCVHFVMFPRIYIENTDLGAKSLENDHELGKQNKS